MILLGSRGGVSGGNLKVHRMALCNFEPYSIPYTNTLHSVFWQCQGVQRCQLTHMRLIVITDCLLG